MATKNYLTKDGLLFFWTKLKATFVHQESGKGLSANDLTDALKSNYDTAYAYSQATHAPTDAEKNAIVGIQKNGTDLTINSTTRKVNISVPTNNNQLTNGAGYQTAAEVESAITAKGYATATEVAAAIANAGHLKRQKVSSLPSVSAADANTIYMVPVQDATGDNQFVEWMLIDGEFEIIGGSDVDLSGYVEESDLVAITNDEINAIVAS